VTCLPEPPGHLLTIAEYAALGEDDRYRWELQEGNLVMSPSPTPRHMIASGELRDQLKAQLPPHLRVIQDVDIDLHLAPADQPGLSRRSDLIVVDQKAVDRRWCRPACDRPARRCTSPRRCFTTAAHRAPAPG
jgi:hypothetical protein